MVNRISLPAVFGKLYVFNIKIADLTVGISCAHELTRRLCEEYLVETGSPTFTVEINETDKEKLRNFFLSFSEVFSESYIESTAIYNKICNRVLNYNAAVFHAALVSVDGMGVAFAAPSGTGKTTHIKLWKRLFGDKVEIVNGDKPLFTFRNGSFFASGMPWCGKENLGCNKTVPLKAVCFLDRADQNSIFSLNDNYEIMSRLFLQLIMPEEQHLMINYLEFANNMINTVPFFLLKCNMDIDAAHVAYEGIFGINR